VQGNPETEVKQRQRPDIYREKAGDMSSVDTVDDFDLRLGCTTLKPPLWNGAAVIHAPAISTMSCDLAEGYPLCTAVLKQKNNNCY